MSSGLIDGHVLRAAFDSPGPRGQAGRLPAGNPQGDEVDQGRQTPNADPSWSRPCQAVGVATGLFVWYFGFALRQTMKPLGKTSPRRTKPLTRASAAAGSSRLAHREDIMILTPYSPCATSRNWDSYALSRGWHTHGKSLPRSANKGGQRRRVGPSQALTRPHPVSE